MTQDPAYRMPLDQPATPRTVRRLNIGRLWAGGLATAIVTALIVVVGVLVARQVLGSAALAPQTGKYADGTVVSYALLAAAAALLATILMNLLLLAVPQPSRFFGWIVGLLTAVVAILPFTMTGPTGPKIASALINLVVGIAILALLGSIAAGAVRRAVPPDGYEAPTVI